MSMFPPVTVGGTESTRARGVAGDAHQAHERRDREAAAHARELAAQGAARSAATGVKTLTLPPALKKRVEGRVVDPRLRVGARQRAPAVPVADDAVRHPQLQVEHLDPEHVAGLRAGHRHRTGDDVRTGPVVRPRRPRSPRRRGSTLVAGTPKPLK